MSRNVHYKPPFVYFGGKSAIADIVWAALGDVYNYVEPFFGSGAVLFLRPHEPQVETINDADGFVANFWRALRRDSDMVAEHADNPVNECDLHARHLWLLGQRERITERLMGDPDFYDAKAAGWWCWGLNCWIGSGWCSGNGCWQSIDGEMVKADGDGIHRKLPHVGDPGRGVNRQLPHVGDPGQGRLDWLKGYLAWFADRLREARVCCGDWSRICGPSVTFRHWLTGVFLDPPYADTASRTDGLYAVDCQQFAHDVRAWAIEQGENPLMRIVLAGYEREHEMPSSWRAHAWEAAGGYALQGEEDSPGRANSKRERLWFSPHCVDRESSMPLFGNALSALFEGKE